MSKPQKHHPVWPRRQWVSMESTKGIRANMGIVMLDPDTHSQLHEKIPFVPVLSPCVSFRAVQEFGGRTHGTGVERAERLINAVDIAIRHNTTHHVERQVGMLTMGALAAQLPFLERELY